MNLFLSVSALSICMSVCINELRRKNKNELCTLIKQKIELFKKSCGYLFYMVCNCFIVTSFCMKCGCNSPISCCGFDTWISFQKNLQKKNKIGNLLSLMRKEGIIENLGTIKDPKWVKK